MSFFSERFLLILYAVIIIFLLPKNIWFCKFAGLYSTLLFANYKNLKNWPFCSTRLYMLKYALVITSTTSAWLSLIRPEGKYCFSLPKFLHILCYHYMYFGRSVRASTLFTSEVIIKQSIRFRFRFNSLF